MNSRCKVKDRLARQYERLGSFRLVAEEYPKVVTHMDVWRIVEHNRFPKDREKLRALGVKSRDDQFSVSKENMESTARSIINHLGPEKARQLARILMYGNRGRMIASLEEMYVLKVPTTK